MKYDEKVHHSYSVGVIVFFSSLSFYHGLDMFLATRDALVINGSYPGFFTSSHGKIHHEWLEKGLGLLTQIRDFESSEMANLSFMI